MPSEWGPSSFQCSACKGWLRVTRSTRLAAFFGGLGGMAVAWFAYVQCVAWLNRTGAHPPPTWLSVVAGVGAYLACAIPIGRRTLKLQRGPEKDTP